MTPPQPPRAMTGPTKVMPMAGEKTPRGPARSPRQARSHVTQCGPSREIIYLTDEAIAGVIVEVPGRRELLVKMTALSGAPFNCDYSIESIGSTRIRFAPAIFQNSA
jgi:hypothetical protein